MKQKNSLIEVYRFLFSLWVVYFHDLFILPQTSIFDGGRISVDFFFVLSGFYIMSTLNKNKEKPFLDSFFDVSRNWGEVYG